MYVYIYVSQEPIVNTNASCPENLVSMNASCLENLVIMSALCPEKEVSMSDRECFVSRERREYES